MQFTPVLLAGLSAIITFAGLTIAAPVTLTADIAERQLLGNTLPVDSAGHLLSGVLGDVVSLVGFKPLVDACNERDNLFNPEIIVVLTYTANPSKVYMLTSGQCAPYDDGFKGSMDLVYWCKATVCHPMGNDECSIYGNIGETPLPLPAGFFLPNVLDVADLLGHAALCFKTDGLL